MDKTQIAIAVFDKYASEYQHKFMDTGLYHDTFDLFCNSIKTGNADVLEIACGPGNITQYLLQKRPDFNITGIDLAPNMIALAEKNNPTAQFKIMDCRDIGRIKKKYDGIMCGFCLPYLSKQEVLNLIKDAAGLLETSGVVYLSTMEDDHNKSGFKKGSKGDEIYMHYYEADHLTEMLEENGFTIIELQRKGYPAADGTETTDLVIIAGR